MSNLVWKTLVLISKTSSLILSVHPALKSVRFDLEIIHFGSKILRLNVETELLQINEGRSI